MTTTRIGLAGYGFGGRIFHAPLIASTPGLTLSTVVTGNAQRQAEARLAYPDCQVISDPELVELGRRVVQALRISGPATIQQ